MPQRTLTFRQLSDIHGGRQVRLWTHIRVVTLAGETGLPTGTLEKVLRLMDVLQEIARDPVLADRLVLKGGTALNVFHLKLDRLSVDIDLNYVGALDRQAMEAEAHTPKPAKRGPYKKRTE